MTNQQAGEIVEYVMMMFPRLASDRRQGFDDDTQIAWVKHLRPLPYERTKDCVQLLCAGSSRQPDAIPFPPSMAEVLVASGVVDDDTRRDLMKAIRDGGHLSRDIRSVTGWAYIAPGLPEPPPPPLVLPEPEPPRGQIMDGPIVGQNVRAMLRELARKGQRPDGATPRPWERVADVESSDGTP